MRFRRRFCCVLAVVLTACLWPNVLAAGKAAEGSARPEEEIRLIVRADDIGSSHAANVACMKSYRDGVTKAFTSEVVKEVIKKRKIRLISYRDLSGD